MSAFAMIILVWLMAKMICPGYSIFWLLGWVLRNFAEVLFLIVVFVLFQQIV